MTPFGILKLAAKYSLKPANTAQNDLFEIDLDMFERNRTTNVARSVLLALAIGCLPAVVSYGQDESDKGWVSMFNGRDLEGWTPKIRYSKLGENHNDTFRVEDGVLKVRYDERGSFFTDDGKPRFGHLFYKDSFSHYRMRFEYRFVGEQVSGGPGWALRNSGVMVHGQKPESMAVDQDFPVSIEVQLLGGDGNKPRSTGNLCTPGTNVVMKGKLQKKHCHSSNSDTYHGDQWVKCEIEVRGSKIVKHIINGKTVMEYTEPQLDPRDKNAKEMIKDDNLLLESGSISLQSESHPCDFRNIEIKVLKAD